MPAVRHGVPLAVAASAALGLASLAAQVSNLVIDPGRWDEVLAWVFGGGAVLCASVAAAVSEGGQTRTGRAWRAWAIGAVFLVGGALGVAGLVLATGSVPLLAYAPWLGFAVAGVAGLAFRSSPGSFAFPLFVLDGLPAVLAAVAFIRVDSGQIGPERLGAQLISLAFPALFALLALIAAEVVLVERHRLLENVSIVAAGFATMAVATIAWVSPVDHGFALGGWSDALWTAGALAVALGGCRAALAPEQSAAMGLIEGESGARALLPVAGVAALVLLVIEQYGRYHALVWTTLVAIALLAARFFLVRRATSHALEREQSARGEIEQARRQLAEQNERLLELDRLKDSLVASVSHELRTPLTSIVGYLELVRAGEAGELTPEQDSFLAVVDRNAQRLLDVVGDLLFIAQSDADSLSLERGTVDLEALVFQALEAAAPAADAKGIRLDGRTGATPGFAGDPARLAQVIDNLLSNAIKFTPAGGSVEVRTSTAGRRAVLEVIDSGMGLSDAERARLFERFYRTAAANEQAIPGTGLGLAIVKAIVDAHGGEIAVESRQGKGTTFRIGLPLEPLPAGAAR
ncbi:MAG: sensor histidine kinase [Gaiellaceae bacterium]